MKKLIGMIILLIFIWLLVSSCGSNPTTFVDGAIITSVESQHSYLRGCIYYTTEKSDYKMSNYGWFCDDCSKYKVGDTVQTIKYSEKVR